MTFPFRQNCQCCQRRREKGQRICDVCTAAGCIAKPWGYVRGELCPHKRKSRNMYSPGARSAR